MIIGILSLNRERRGCVLGPDMDKCAQVGKQTHELDERLRAF